MQRFVLFGGAVFTPFEVIEGGAVSVADGRIDQVGPRAAVVAEGAVELDVGGRIICPGFVDLQVNGGGGAFLSDDPGGGALERMARAHVQFGTTSMLATAVTGAEASMRAALVAVKEHMLQPPPGARVIGAHLEGPFINPRRRGAHREQFIQPPSKELFDRLLDAAGGSLRLITLAPELPGALELVERARAASVVVAAGHSDATYDETQRALAGGVSAGTHVFNAMRPLEQREPGVIGALLQDGSAVVTLIADGVHVHPACLELVYRCKGAERTALITDAMPPVGTAASQFRLLGADVTVRGGACYLDNGTLAGSALSMNAAVRNMSDLAGVPLLECVRMATATPARVLGLQSEIGVLGPGARADIAVCNADMSVWKVFVGGELAYAADA